MTRHEVRKEIFKIVYGNEFHPVDSMNEQTDIFMEVRDCDDEDQPISDGMSEAEASEIKSKALDILDKLDEIDEQINSRVEGWKTGRMAKVDLAIIRLAVYEIKYDKLPAGIAINEAVTIADEFGTDNSASFVNGVLAKFSKD